MLVPEVYQAIIDEFQEEVITMPDTVKGWREVAAQFEDGERWPHNLAPVGSLSHTLI